MLYYAGIGSRRRTPDYILNMMTILASKLEEKGYILRTGHAQGADQAFEAGVIHDEHKEIFTAKDATPQAIAMASGYHEFWDNCDAHTKKLHGRNAMIILGKKFKEPVKFVICYTPDGKFSGGTGLAMKIAETHKILIFNLFYKSVRERIERFIGVTEKVDLL